MTEREHAIDDLPLTVFEGRIESLRQHVSTYADVVTGATFSLHEPEVALTRWRRQIAALRKSVSRRDLMLRRTRLQRFYTLLFSQMYSQR